MRNIALCAAALFVFALAALPARAELASQYSVAGRNTDGNDYTGSVAFKATGQIYRSDYTGGDGNETVGPAIEYENFLGVAVTTRDGSGGYLALYKRVDSGWAGIFTSYDDDDLAAEVLYNGRAPALLNPKAKVTGVEGTYEISGTNPDGSTYSGEIEITAGSGIFDVDRTTGKDETSGTAIVLNGAVIMNVTAGDDTPRAKIGVVGVFVPQGNGFLGVWNKPGEQRLGAERWVRK
jgi:hypothetical protein